MRAARTISLAVALGVVAVAAAQMTGDAATQTQGQAQAVLAKIVPYVGLAGVTVSIGLTTAQVAGPSAQASAAAADFGLLGTLAGSSTASIPEIPGLPPLALPDPATADSNGTMSADSDPIPVPGQDGIKAPDAAAPSFSAAHQHASATPSPVRAQGLATGPDLNVPGLIAVMGGRSQAVSDATRSVSDVSIGSVSLGAGAVVLSDLHWTATQTAQALGSAEFAIGGLSVAGQALPVTGADALATALTKANTALAPLGLALSVPTWTNDRNGAVVAPLVVQVRNPEAIATETQQATAAATPALGPVLAGLLKAIPGSAASALVVNALLGGVGGQSGGRLELGGVSARSGALDVLDPGAPTFPAVPVGLPSVPVGVTADVPRLPRASSGYGMPAVAAVNTAAAVPGGQPQAVGMDRRAAVFARGGGSPGQGAAVALGLGCLAILALVVGDRIRARIGASLR